MPIKSQGITRPWKQTGRLRMQLTAHLKLSFVNFITTKTWYKLHVPSYMIINRSFIVQWVGRNNYEDASKKKAVVDQDSRRILDKQTQKVREGYKSNQNYNCP